MASIQDDKTLILYFNRVTLLFGQKGLEKFHKSTVAVVGLGGVGSFAAELLIRSGIGSLVLIDFDRINETNINRQLPALSSTIGEYKVSIMKERLSEINPQAEIFAHQVFCDYSNREILLKDVDFIVDAIDSLGPKAGLLEYSYLSGKKIISCMGAANRIDPSRIKMADISEVKGCPLASRVKKYLRKRDITQGIPVIYSDEEPLSPENDISPVKDRSSFVRGRERQVLGSSSYLPAIIAGWAVSYVLRSLSNKM